MAMRPDDVLRPSLASTPVYRTHYVRPGPGQVKLNHNEADADLEPELKEEIFERLRHASWHRYPDPFHDELKAALSEITGHPPEGILVTNGGNDAIARLLQAMHPDGTVVTCPPSYYLYHRVPLWLGLTLRTVHLRPDYTVDVPAVLAAATAPSIFLHPSPNNPTGNCLRDEAIDALLDGFPGLVLVDEAYQDFSGRTVAGRTADHGNLVVLRTFSKAYGVAGIRLGWLLGDPAWISAIDKVTTPYSVDLFSQVAGAVLLRHPERVRARVERVRTQRARLRAALDEVDGLSTVPSESNYFLVHLSPELGSPTSLVEDLKAQGIILRDASMMPLLSDCFRVTVGLPDENDRVCDAVAAWATARAR